MNHQSTPSFQLQRYKAGKLPPDCDSWILSQSSGTWFQTVEAFRAVWNLEPEIIEITDSSSGERLAVFTFFNEKKGALSYPKRHSLLYFSAPVFSDKNADKIPELLNFLLTSGSFSFALLNPAYQDQKFPGLEFKTVPQTGLWLDLLPDESVQIKQTSESVRRNLKKLVSGQFEWISPDKLSLTELELLEKSYQHHGVKCPVSAKELHGVLSRVSPDHVLAIRYVLEGRTRAWRLWIYDKRGWLTDWLSAVDRDSGKEPVGYHLVWESVKKAREMSCNGLDFGGGNTPGIADFKEKFGCRKRHGLLIRYSRNTVVSVLLSVNDWLLQRKRKSGL